MAPSFTAPTARPVAFRWDDAGHTTGAARKSDDSGHYTVTRNGERFRCTCRGFLFTGHCKHADAARAKHLAPPPPARYCERCAVNVARQCGLYCSDRCQQAAATEALMMMPVDLADAPDAGCAHTFYDGGGPDFTCTKCGYCYTEEPEFDLPEQPVQAPQADPSDPWSPFCACIAPGCGLAFAYDEEEPLYCPMHRAPAVSGIALVEVAESTPDEIAETQALMRETVWSLVAGVAPAFAGIA